MSELIARLERVLSRLTERDQIFAGSLLRQAKEFGVTEKQIFWMNKLCERAALVTPAPAFGADPVAPVTAPAPKPAPVTLVKPAVTLPVIPLAPEFAPIVALFQRAGGKRPRIVFESADGVAFRLTVAGVQSRFPGSINVTDNSGDFEGRTWFGRIHTDGRFDASRREDPTAIANVTRALAQFAADPAAEARAYGHRTGNCCFCNTTLTHGASIKLGYGPICADRWGLPHSYADEAPALACEVVAVEGGGA